MLPLNNNKHYNAFTENIEQIIGININPNFKLENFFYYSLFNKIIKKSLSDMDCNLDLTNIYVDYESISEILTFSDKLFLVKNESLQVVSHQIFSINLIFLTILSLAGIGHIVYKDYPKENAIMKRIFSHPNAIRGNLYSIENFINSNKISIENNYNSIPRDFSNLKFNINQISNSFREIDRVEYLRLPYGPDIVSNAIPLMNKEIFFETVIKSPITIPGPPILIENKNILATSISEYCFFDLNIIFFILFFTLLFICIFYKNIK